MKHGHRGHQQEVEHPGQEAHSGAVAVYDGGHAVGVAGPDQNGLGIDVVGKGRAHIGTDPPAHRHRHDIAQQHGPGVFRMGPGVAGRKHTKHNAEGRSAEPGSHQIVVSQNEEAEDAEVHQEHIVPQGAAHAGHPLRAIQQPPILLRRAAHKRRPQNAGAAEQEPVTVGDDLGGHLQGLRVRSAGQVHPQSLKQDGLEDKGPHAHRQGGIVEIIALVHIGGMAQPRRDKEAADQAHKNRQDKPGPAVADHAVHRVPDQDIRHQGRNARGEEHGGDVIFQRLFLHGAIEHSAPDGGPDILDVDAPGAEAHREDQRHGGRGIHFRPQCHIESQAHKGDQAHIQERGREAAYGKIVGGDLAGLTQDLGHTGKHPCPVRHTHSSRQKEQGEEGEKEFEKIAFFHIFEFFHLCYLIIKKPPALSCMERVPPQRRVWRGPLTIKTGLIHWEGVVPLIRLGYAEPPSPWGKAASRRGSIHRGPFFIFRGPLHTRPGLRPVHPRKAQRAFCGTNQ